MNSLDNDVAPVFALGEQPAFAAGDHVRVSTRVPIGHYRVPQYVRGKNAVVESIVEPPQLDNEQEGYGRNAGDKRHYYRIAIPMSEVWQFYSGAPCDTMRIEVYETWLERTDA